MIKVVLVEPEIGWNTGNIGRTCLALGVQLHIVGPTGYSLSDKQVKRAGLDYWKDVSVSFHSDLDSYLLKYQECPFYFFSAHADKIYTDISYGENDSLIFGKESTGLGSELIQKFSSYLYKIPVQAPIRSLNLSTAAGIVLYESYRQLKRA